MTILKIAIIIMLMSGSAFGFEVGDRVETSDKWVTAPIEYITNIHKDRIVEKRYTYSVTEDGVWTEINFIEIVTREWPVDHKPITKGENIMSFMFGVLGSVTFWIVFGAMGIFVGTLLLRQIAPSVLNWIKEGEKIKDGWWGPPSFFIIIGCFMLWPITLIATLIVFIIRRLLWPLFVKTIRASISLVPDIEIKKKKDQ